MLCQAGMKEWRDDPQVRHSSIHTGKTYDSEAWMKSVAKAKMSEKGSTRKSRELDSNP